MTSPAATSSAAWLPPSTTCLTTRPRAAPSCRRSTPARPQVAERTVDLADANAEPQQPHSNCLVMSEARRDRRAHRLAVAHEISNPTAVIQGNLDLLRIAHCQRPVANEIRLIHEQVGRIRLIVQAAAVRPSGRVRQLRRGRRSERRARRLPGADAPASGTRRGEGGAAPAATARCRSTQGAAAGADQPHRQRRAGHAGRRHAHAETVDRDPRQDARGVRITCATPAAASVPRTWRASSIPSLPPRAPGTGLGLSISHTWSSATVAASRWTARPGGRCLHGEPARRAGVSARDPRPAVDGRGRTNGKRHERWVSASWSGGKMTLVGR